MQLCLLDGRKVFKRLKYFEATNVVALGALTPFWLKNVLLDGAAADGGWRSILGNAHPSTRTRRGLIRQAPANASVIEIIVRVGIQPVSAGSSKRSWL